MLKLLVFLMFVTDFVYFTSAQDTDSSTPDNIRFIVYSNTENYNLTGETVKNLNLNVQTVFVVHGLLGGSNHMSYNTNITSAYRDLGYNAILVDWSRYNFVLNYFLLILRGISDIGTALGDKIILLASNGFNVKQIEIVGASIGAHIAGYAGRYVEGLINAKIHRIVGLDPAGTLLGRIFGIFENPYALRSTDADIVDASHTNDQLLGTDDNIGTIDIYVNGGLTQTACSETPQAMSIFGGIVINACSHLFSEVLYLLTIGNTNYKASVNADTCENLIVYGDEFNGNATGIYFLRTQDVYPYKSYC